MVIEEYFNSDIRVRLEENRKERLRLDTDITNILSEYTEGIENFLKANGMGVIKVCKGISKQTKGYKFEYC